ncbi:AcrR family transcriptional regulator [Pseudarthrobacter sp. PvP004]|uniref:TetR/AcrR family transcriptional regulator n=1 Tax=Pseudarthrobacter sp. PvP004 TaxID=2817850 RepID=UPI001AE9A767|nr:TetR/AcrR family transcriptional regulator [Pseudarthrobacter sp. PvP004]MBP2266357.1 AcrR family transcriptional regulator [Pseudarthrobacter sp. PvP004]
MPGGRKRGFDDQVALQTAMELFWRQGYEGTSIADLTKALGINPPSLYAAFGSKRDLFEKTLDRYMCERSVQLEDAMAQPTAHEAVLDLLTGRVRVFTSPGQPAGCMTVQAGLSSGEPHHEIVDLLAAAREEIRQTVLDRLDKALADGDLPAGTNCTALARYVMAAIYGLSVEAASGAPREELMAAAELAAQVVPRG